MRKITALLCFYLLLIITAKAQQDFLMYNMNEIPQSSYSNPSNQFNGKFFIGLPLMSSNYYSVSNSGFAYSDAIKKNGDSLLLDFKALIKELEDENFISFNTKIDLFSLGFQIGKRTQIGLNVTENINFRFNYTKDLIRFVYEGNGAFEDNTANFENVGIAANYYREYGLNISHQFTNKLRLGTRLKYLYGIANIYSEKTDLSLTTDPNNFNLSAQADVAIKTSGVNNFDDTESSDFISSKDNSGFGIDLGGNYELNNKLSFNASILDIGYITWNSDNKNYTIPGGQYTYKGIEIDAFTSEKDSSGNNSFDRVLDSLEEAFSVKESEESYTTPLVSRVYLGANYKLNKKILLGGLIQSEFFKGTVRPSFTVSFNYKATKWINLATSYTAINRSYNNLGLGFSINPGPVQLYVMSDNILGAIQPQHTRHTQVRFGINLIFGSKKVKEIHPSFNGVTDVKPKKEKKAKEEEIEESPNTEEKQEINNNIIQETDSLLENNLEDQVEPATEVEDDNPNTDVPEAGEKTKENTNEETEKAGQEINNDSIQGEEPLERKSEDQVESATEVEDDDPNTEEPKDGEKTKENSNEENEVLENQGEQPVIEEQNIEPESETPEDTPKVEETTDEEVESLENNTEDETEPSAEGEGDEPKTEAPEGDENQENSEPEQP